MSNFFTSTCNHGPLEEEPKTPDNFIVTNSPEFKPIYKKWMEHLNTIDIDYYTIKRHVIGNISQKLTADLLASLRSLPRRDFDRYDCNPSYVATAIKQKEMLLWQRFLPFFNFEKEQLGLVKQVCEELQPTIEEYLGTPFRIINMKGFETKPGSCHFGPNKVHTDSMYPTHTYKVFLYLTGASEEIGTTKLFPGKHKETITVRGPPGTFLLFNPVCMGHAGVPPREVTRAMLELTLVPSHETEIKPTFNGTASTQPIEP